MVDPTALETLWFVLIAVLWLGYFFLEGFDFGVGMLLPVLGRDEAERRVVLGTIGPVWDGNEVWLLVAGGATFAAFPEWYATLFSGFYLALLLILLALIVRNVAFEFRGKHDAPGWVATWDWAVVIGSAVPALLWGVAFANILRGVPMDARHEYTGTLFDLLNPYALLGGVASLLLFAAHGSAFLALRTQDDLRLRAGRLSRWLSPLAAAVAGGFLAWTLAHAADIGHVRPWTVAAAAGSIVLAAVVAPLAARRREGWAFAGGGGAILLFFLTIFGTLWPNVLVSSTSAANDLTVANASSTGYTLTVMTVVAAVLTPVVLAYQAWTYWIFRRRIGGGGAVAPEPGEAPPALPGA